MTTYRLSTVPPNPRGFHEEAQFQRVCANCGAGGRYDAHHVVPKQRLKRLGHYELLYDPRNCLRLCAGVDTIRCHEQLEARKLRLETRTLTQDNICFIYQTLGPAGRDFLERNYTGVDRRFTLHEDQQCPLCQPPEL